MPMHPYTDQEWLKLSHVVLTSEVYWDPTCLDSPGSVDNEIWYDIQSSISQCLSNRTFNDHGELRDINQQDMHYFDAFGYDSYEDIYNVIDTYVEIHNTANSNKYVDKNVYSCNSFFTFFSYNLHQKESTSNNTTIHKKEPEYAKLKPHFYGCPFTLSRRILRQILNITKQIRLKSLRVTTHLIS